MFFFLLIEQFLKNEKKYILRKIKMSNPCQQNYWNIIELLTNKDKIDPRALFRELEQTSKCDHINDLSYVRQKIMNSFGDESRLTKVIGFDPLNNVDVEYMTATLIHHNQFILDRVLKGLTYQSSFYYWTFFKSEEMLAKIGLVDSVGCISRWVPRKNLNSRT